jgi:hypothetical protein
MEGEQEPAEGRSLSSDLKEILLWALVAAGITVVFGAVLDVLEALM